MKVGETSVEVQGPKGKLTSPIPQGMRIDQVENHMEVIPIRREKGMTDKEAVEMLSRQEKANWGLGRALLANAVKGVTDGFSKDLEIVGVGYRAELVGKMVKFSLGFSHPVEFPLPDGITVTIEKQTQLTVSGNDKQVVGQVAANMRALRPPDPYKQKGVRLVGEYLRKKAGKAAASATGT